MIDIARCRDLGLGAAVVLSALMQFFALPISAKILRLPRSPGLAPELAATVDRECFAGDEFSGRCREVDGRLRDIERRARAHHRVGARVGGARLQPSVSIALGATQLTRMFSGAHSTATACNSPMTPDRAAIVCAMP